LAAQHILPSNESIAMKPLLLLAFLLAVPSSAYNTPDCPTWPSLDTWSSDLASMLSTEAALHGPIPNTAFAADCLSHGTDAYAISRAGNGICMHSYSCAYEFCRPDVFADKEMHYDLPEYVVEAKVTADVQAAMVFAAAHDIEVSIKMTGHSYQGSSTARNSLLIWMQHFEADGAITQDYVNSCGTVTDTAVIGVSGGMVWDDILVAAAADYHVVAGGGRTVGVAGGWLQGSGLSFSSREYGIGIDNVVDFDVVLANGTLVKADACTNPDLFWALRGGGGGTFGAVVHIHYKAHPKTNVIDLSWFLLGTPTSDAVALKFITQWLEYWIQISPSLDNRWSGYFNALGCSLVFTGTLEEAQPFLDEFDSWYENVLDKSTMVLGVWGSVPPSEVVVVHDNWYEYRGGDSCAGVPDSPCTDDTGDAYEFFEFIGARLMPRDVVVNKPEETLQFFLDLLFAGQLLGVNYYLGGKMMDVAPDATAVNPAMRNALYSIITVGLANDIVREFLPNNITGACFNHHDPAEPDWRNALWGSNYERLLELKNIYDPDRRFNCWHCVGYEGDEFGEAPVAPPACPEASTIAPVTVAPVSTTAPATSAPVSTTTAPATSGPVHIDNTDAPATAAPISGAPVTAAPVMTTAPVTAAPISGTPVTTAPVSAAPVDVTGAPVTASPVEAPTSGAAVVRAEVLMMAMLVTTLMMFSGY
jgi:hypothetical protein